MMLVHPARPRVMGWLLLTISALAGSAFAQHQLSEVPQGVSDFDSRTAWVQPTPQQISIASQLGTVRWNHFGTPQSLIHYGGYLATGLGSDPVAAASSFIRSNASALPPQPSGAAKPPTPGR